MNRGPFRVSPTGPIREAIIRLRDRASEAGLYEPVARSLREIEGHLELHPETWGDPVREIKSLRLMVYRRVYDKLAVEYGVHQEESIVFLLVLHPTLDHPLRPQDEDE